MQKFWQKILIYSPIYFSNVAPISFDKIPTSQIAWNLFIHYGDLYSASSGLPLPTLPWLTKQFWARVECVGKNPGERLLCEIKPIPQQWGQPQRRHGPGL